MWSGIWETWICNRALYLETMTTRKTKSQLINIKIWPIVVTVHKPKEPKTRMGIDGTKNALKTRWAAMKCNETMRDALKTQDPKWNAMKYLEPKWNAMKYQETKWNAVRNLENGSHLRIRCHRDRNHNHAHLVTDIISRKDEVAKSPSHIKEFG